MITAPEGRAKINLQILNIYTSWKLLISSDIGTHIKGSPQAARPRQLDLISN